MRLPTVRGLWAILIGAAITVAIVVGIPAVGSPAPGDDLEVTPLGVVYDVFSSPCVIGDRMLFVTTGNDELWVTDGTIENTSLVAALDGYTNLGCAVLDGRLYFTVSEIGWSDDKTQLWVTDGTSSGTVMLADFGQDHRIGVSLSGGLWVAAGSVFFVVSEPARGTELWMSDGTDAGTRLLTALSPAKEVTRIEQVMTFGDRAAFVVNGELWVSDSTPAGTRLAPGFGNADGLSEPDTLTAFGDRLLFNTETGVQVSDGDTSTTLLTATARLRPGQLINGRFVFQSSAPARDAEVWVTDGTIQGTQLLKTGATFLQLLGDQLVFRATSAAPGMWELWITDGTPAGTQMIKQIESGTPTSFAAVGDLVVFRTVSGDPGTWELWETDGTPGGTQMITEIESSTPTSFTAVGDRLVFGVFQCCVDPGEVWVSDLTPSGTHRLPEINPALKPRVFGAQYPIYSYGFTQLGNRVVFGAVDLAASKEGVASMGGLWVTDGTPAGTGLVAEISGLAEFRAVGDKVIFIAGARRPDLVEEQFYAVARDRDAPVEVADYNDAANLASVINAGNYSNEYDAPVLRLYQAYFNREPDLAGAKYWLNIRRQDHGLLQIAGFMSDGQEFANNYSGVDDTEYLRRVYDNMLGRIYDQAGFNYWLDLLRGTNQHGLNPNLDQLNRSGVVFYVTGGTEFINNYPYTK